MKDKYNVLTWIRFFYSFLILLFASAGMEVVSSAQEDTESVYQQPHNHAREYVLFTVIFMLELGSCVAMCLMIYKRRIKHASFDSMFTMDYQVSGCLSCLRIAWPLVIAVYVLLFILDDTRDITPEQG